MLFTGANYLTDGASSVSRRLRVSEFLIGVTVVAVGTSMPELVVSVMSAAEGKSDVAIGNIVGSNIFNIYAILGITALCVPLVLTRTNIRRDVIICLAVSLWLTVISLDGTLWGGSENVISRADGIVMLVLYGTFLWYMIRDGKLSGEATTPSNETKPRSETPLWLSLLMIAGGLAALIFGADIFLDGSIELARRMGASEATIAIILVAGGTSLPELAATLISALKGKTDIAIGNILGSNIANILLILGISSTIAPLRLGEIGWVDMLVMISAVVAIWISAYTLRRRKIDRLEGVAFLVIYALYVWWLVG